MELTIPVLRSHRKQNVCVQSLLLVLTYLLYHHNASTTGAWSVVESVYWMILPGEGGSMYVTGVVTQRLSPIHGTYMAVHTTHCICSVNTKRIKSLNGFRAVWKVHKPTVHTRVSVYPALGTVRLVTLARYYERSTLHGKCLLIVVTTSPISLEPNFTVPQFTKFHSILMNNSRLLWILVHIRSEEVAGPIVSEMRR